MELGGSRLNLPIGMILRCLPPEVLAADISEFEATGAAATEIGLPMAMILGQVPSGKVEMALQDLIPHFPTGFLQPTESITAYLPSLVNLPLMDVVMRIPPDLLALRPDQKGIDAAVINMADPFTEEILREQAEAARRQAQSNIIEESQAPQEEFVPRNQAGIVPPRRGNDEPATPNTVAPPSIPSPTSRTLSSGLGSAPIRTTTPLPPRAQEATALTSAPPVNPPSQPSAPVPPVPRHTGPIPAPPPPRHTTSLPNPRRNGPLPQNVPTVTSPEPVAPIAEEKPAMPTAGVPDAGADDLQRLAALAMAQLGDGPEVSSPPSPQAAASIPAPAPIIRETYPVSPAMAPQPEVAPATSSAVPPPAAETDASAASGAPVAFNLNTCTAEDLVQNIPGCLQELAQSIIEHRTKIGSYKRLEDLLDVPGMTKATYTNLTGEAPPANRIPLSLNELLGFPAEQQTSLKDVTDRIACWPDVTGCVLSQNSGLSLVGTVPPGIDKAAIVAFAPRMFDALNKSFTEVAGKETDAMIIPTTETSFHLFRNNDLYLIIMSRLPQMPERHVKVARFVLAALSVRTD
jgi:competence ComEA-like helix-hairpin-helix protein